MQIPSTLRAGDTWSWIDSLPDYPAATYTLKYVLYKYGQAAQAFTAVGSGTTFTVTVTAANTVGIAQGEWGWTAYVEKGAGASLERYTIGEGRVNVKPSFPGAIATTDHRSHARKMLDGINAVLEGRASKAETALTLNGRSIQYLKPAELMAWRNYYETKVRAEDAEETGVHGASLTRIEFGGT